MAMVNSAPILPRHSDLREPDCELDPIPSSTLSGPPANTLLAEPTSSPAPEPSSTPASGDDDCEDGDDNDDDGDDDCEDEPSSSAYEPSSTPASFPTPSGGPELTPTSTPTPTPTPSPEPSPSSSTNDAAPSPTPTPTPDNSNNSGTETHTGGDLTWFTQNGVAGACGSVHSDNDFIAALDTSVYGDTSVQSSYCGKTIRISWQGNSVDVVVADACPTCDNASSVDLSEAAFQALAPLSTGLLTDATWTLLN
ncbi:hypothetical protein BJ322DRAFT_1102732 [Thelephora terrestris]|uniref:RlpA-like protein double-psi beta-barrel domain-containing protein n=1 Tax=Thelephora terrestris TaxID=56493 RepID=A0A9P6HQ49_9AGAM|nr:hypothetical protein BJ322DRAFT_1102732 [Thelephora terrestris]